MASNFEKSLRDEISRIVRKEVRSEIEPLRKIISQQRAEIARLKREHNSQQKVLKHVVVPTKKAAMEFASPEQDAENGIKRRFSPERLAAHRARLGLSADQYGLLIGLSGASIYKYEKGHVRPQPGTIGMLSQIRSMSDKAIQEKLEALQEQAPA